MSNAFFEVPVAENEPVLSYGPGSAEKKAVKSIIKRIGKTDLLSFTHDREVTIDLLQLPEIGFFINRQDRLRRRKTIYHLTW